MSVVPPLSMVLPLSVVLSLAMLGVAVRGADAVCIGCRCSCFCRCPLWLSLSVVLPLSVVLTVRAGRRCPWCSLSVMLTLPVNVVAVRGAAAVRGADTLPPCRRRSATNGTGRSPGTVSGTGTRSAAMPATRRPAGNAWGPAAPGPPVHRPSIAARPAASNWLPSECGRGAAPGTLGHCWVLFDNIGHYWAVLGNPGHHWVLLGTIGYCWAPLGTTGYH